MYFLILGVGGILHGGICLGGKVAHGLNEEGMKLLKDELLSALKPAA